MAQSGQDPLQWTITGVPYRESHGNMEQEWDRCGPDTLHVTFKEGGGRSPLDLASLLQEFQVERDLPTGVVVRDKGVSGFAQAAVDQAAGLRLDWTRTGEEGANAGFFCLQVKGEWFDKADGEATADFLQLLDAYGLYRVTRIDLQQTVKTTKYLTPWWIRAFETGHLRVIGKSFFEPRGRKAAYDDYPAGATIYHGARTSERFARQYDRHKKTGAGPARRRDEVEIKGQSARDLWSELLEDMAQGEQLGQDRGARLRSFSKRSIRAYLPIRDTSKWAGKDLPKNWASMASEPTTWAALFEEEAKGIKPAPGRVSSMLKSYRYATQNFGAAVAVKTLSECVKWEQRGYSDFEAQEQAVLGVIYDFVNEANEDRVRDFMAELPPSQRNRLEELWLSFVRAGGDAADADRSNHAREAEK